MLYSSANSNCSFESYFIEHTNYFCHHFINGDLLSVLLECYSYNVEAYIVMIPDFLDKANADQEH